MLRQGKSCVPLSADVFGRGIFPEKSKKILACMSGSERQNVAAIVLILHHICGILLQR